MTYRDFTRKKICRESVFVPYYYKPKKYPPYLKWLKNKIAEGMVLKIDKDRAWLDNGEYEMPVSKAEADKVINT